MPALRLVAPQGRQLDLLLRTRMEHIRHRRRVPRVPAPMDFDTVPLMRPLVAAVRLVRAQTTIKVIASGT
jgi:hypothetical protein